MLSMSTISTTYFKFVKSVVLAIPGKIKIKLWQYFNISLVKIAFKTNLNLPSLTLPD